MKHKPVRISNLFEIKDGKVVRKNRYCPRCGIGVFLAKHKNRLTCGKCGYTEIFKNEA
jgi:small subunit ribosomal protein S27Ae